MDHHVWSLQLVAATTTRGFGVELGNLEVIQPDTSMCYLSTNTTVPRLSFSTRSISWQERHRLLTLCTLILQCKSPLLLSTSLSYNLTNLTWTTSISSMAIRFLATWVGCQLVVAKLKDLSVLAIRLDSTILHLLSWGWSILQDFLQEKT